MKDDNGRRSPTTIMEHEPGTGGWQTYLRGMRRGGSLQRRETAGSHAQNFCVKAISVRKRCR